MGMTFEEAFNRTQKWEIAQIDKDIDENRNQFELMKHRREQFWKKVDEMTKDESKKRMKTKEEVATLNDLYLTMLVASSVGFTNLEASNQGLRGDFDGHRWVKVPEYPKDLNAMYKVEVDFLGSKGLLGVYYETLEETFGHIDVRSATARMRAESFVLTMPDL